MKPFYSQEFPRVFSLFLFQYNPENSRELLGMLEQINAKEFSGGFPGMILGNSREILGFSFEISSLEQYHGD